MVYFHITPSNYNNQTMKLYTLIFEEHSVEDIDISTKEDTSLGENQKQVWIKANHPDLGKVGLMYAIPLSTKQPNLDNEDDDLTLQPNAWNDFDKLRKQISNKPNNVTLWGVQQAWNSQRFRDEGLGKAMYLHLLKYLANTYNGILVSNEAWGGEGATSIPAKNVWKSLANHSSIKHVGYAFWGGNISNINLRAKRLHGWEQREKYKQPRSAALKQALKNQD